MFAQIHAIDDGKKQTEGKELATTIRRINTSIREDEGLAFGEPRERLTLIIEGEEQDGNVRRTLRLELNCQELESILRDAALAGMMQPTGREHVLKLVKELQTALAAL
jgi:hypothetical protein